MEKQIQFNLLIGMGIFYEKICLSRNIETVVLDYIIVKAP